MSDLPIPPQPEVPNHQQPTLRQLLCLDTPSEAMVSPSGKYVAILVDTTDWKENRYETRCLIYDAATHRTTPLIPYNDVSIDYLSESPFHNRDLYLKTAPISNLAQAKTPTLIQHGSDDRRVPLSNAMELYRGLQAMKVPVELFIFPGMGHPITKPRENHAVMHQNLNWLGHYLLGHELKLKEG